MNQIEYLIDSLIDQYNETFPAERIAALERRANKVWDNAFDEDRMVVAAMEKLSAPRAMPEIPADATPNQRYLINELAGLVNKGLWQDDNYPAIYSGLRQALLPSCFGCEEKPGEFGGTKAIIHNTAEVYKLTKPAIAPGTIAHEILETMKYCNDRTKGEIPIYITDMQGPYSIAAQIWGIEDFMMACYEEPEAAHHLLQICTELIEDYFSLMMGSINNLIPLHCLPMLYMPKSAGVAVSDDFLAVTSKDTAAEFSVPYLEKIAETFGGIVVHSCGSIAHMADILNNLKGLRAVNFSATETDLPYMAENISKDIAIITHCSPLTTGDLPLIDQREHIIRCAKIAKDVKRNLMCIAFEHHKDSDALAHRDEYLKLASLV